MTEGVDMNNNTTIIICAAGMGTRLGIGTTKALVRINGKSLIKYQLEQLDQYDDVRVVVGFQAEKLIDAIKEYRKDVMFAFNYDYQSTGPLASVDKAIIGAREYTVVLGGDMLIHPDDFKMFLEYEDQCVGYSRMHSAEPVYLDVDNSGIARSFKQGEGNLEWSGLVKFKTADFDNGSYYVHQMVERLLPVKALETRGIDIDTTDDYDKAVEWVSSGYSDSLLV